MALKKPIPTEEPIADLPTLLERRKSAMTAPELAAVLSLSKAEVYRMIQSGVIPHYRISSAIRLCPQTVAKWLRSTLVSSSGRS